MYRAFLLLLSVIALASAASADDRLVRLRLHAPTSVPPGAKFQVSVVLDSVDFPPAGPVALPFLGLDIGIQVSSQLVVDSAELSSDLKSALVSKIDINGGVISLTAWASTEWTGGKSRVIAKLKMHALPTATGTATFSFVDSATGRRVVQAGGQETSPALRDANLAVSGSKVVHSTLDYPEPTAGEMSSGSSGSSALLGGELYCDFSNFVDFPVGHVVNKFRGTDLAALTALFDSVKTLTAPQVISVPSGTYSGQLLLDLTGLATHVILYAPDGPDSTIFDGGAADAVVVITGNSVATGAALTLGWLEGNIFPGKSPWDGGNAADVIGLWGFEIRNGAPYRGTTAAPVDHGAGVIVGNTNVSVGIVGNHIHSNANPTAGGGLYIYRCGGVEVIATDISFNNADERGAGVCVEEATAEPQRIVINSCWIHKNVMTSPVGTPTEWRGGGLYGSHHDIELCSTRIYENEAADGCGVYFRYIGTITTHNTFYAEENFVYSNKPALHMGALAPGLVYQGGGLSVLRDVTAAVSSRHFGLVRNRVFLNGTRDEGIQAAERVGSGGGLRIDFTVDGSLGPYGLLGGSPTGQLLIGNAFYRNEAEGQGGGVWANMPEGNLPRVRVWTNTVWFNKLWSTTPLGSGLFAQDINSWEGNSNIVNGNNIQVDPGPPMHDWYVLFFGANPFVFSSLPTDPTGISASNLFSATCFEAPPTMIGGVDPIVDARQFDTSSTRNSGQDDLQVPFPLLSVDFDLEGRENPIDPLGADLMDCGADEWYDPFPNFIRGDMNEDGEVDVSDAVAILLALFVPGSPPATCEDAADTNDDGQFDIADATFLLAHLFIMGSPPPPEPFPGCGDDPTSDTLLPCVFDVTVCP